MVAAKNYSNEDCLALSPDQQVEARLRELKKCSAASAATPSGAKRSNSSINLEEVSVEEVNASVVLGRE